MSINNKIDFNVYANNYDKHRVADLKLVDVAIKSLNIDTNHRILDFGCGTGNYLSAMQNRNFNCLFGLDHSNEMCKIAIEKTNLNILQGSHFNIPFENEYFDAIMIIDVIHFIEDIHKLLSEFCRISKTKSRVFIATQSHKQLESRIYSKYFPSTTAIDKLRHHDISNLISISESCRFSLVSVQDYLNNTDFLVDENYFKLIKNKSFYVLRLITEEEFENGIKSLEIDLKNGSFIDKFPGRTLITLEKK
jgi:ubiquinone/menaquinone biosynthesis C-methylase UbiE